MVTLEDIENKKNELAALEEKYREENTPRPMIIVRYRTIDNLLHREEIYNYPNSLILNRPFRPAKISCGMYAEEELPPQGQGVRYRAYGFMDMDVRKERDGRVVHTLYFDEVTKHSIYNTGGNTGEHTYKFHNAYEEWKETYKQWEKRK